MPAILTALDPDNAINEGIAKISTSDWDKYLNITCKCPVVYDLNNAGDMYFCFEGLDKSDSENLSRNIKEWTNSIEGKNTVQELITRHEINVILFHHLTYFIKTSGGFTVEGALGHSEAV